jgi:UDP-GlcNAc3NAcA epimerase
VFVDTGQHWDERMAGTFFGELGLPRPDHVLGVGGGGHSGQTGRMLIALEPILEAERPDAVLVYGDTNSTLAGSLAGAKLGIPVAHVEAGLRNFDRRMPEEINRLLTDHLSTWRFAPTPQGVANLAAEGITAGVVETGELMHDLVPRVAAEVRSPDSLALPALRWPRPGPRPGGRPPARRLHLRHDPPGREPRAVGACGVAGDPGRRSGPTGR